MVFISTAMPFDSCASGERTKRVESNHKGPMENLVYKIKADFLKTLGHPQRLRIIEELKGGERSVGYLTSKFKIGQPNISRHLITLRNAGILTSRQEKTTIYYDIADHDIFNFLRPIAMMLRKKLHASEKILNTLGKD